MSSASSPNSDIAGRGSYFAFVPMGGIGNEMDRQSRPLYCITIIAEAKIAKQIRKSTMFVPFHAIRRALELKVQKLYPALRSCFATRTLLHIIPHQADRATIQQMIFT